MEVGGASAKGVFMQMILSDVSGGYHRELLAVNCAIPLFFLFFHFSNDNIVCM